MAYHYEKILKSKELPPYCGELGVLTKNSHFKKNSESVGSLTTRRLNFFHCPIGLKIGRSAPAEIAVSVSAQLLMSRPFLESIQARVRFKFFPSEGKNKANRERHAEVALK